MGANEHTITSGSIAMLANRVSYHYNFMGPSVRETNKTKLVNTINTSLGEFRRVAGEFRRVAGEFRRASTVTRDSGRRRYWNCGWHSLRLASVRVHPVPPLRREL
eukprot:966520-Prorocentrum_minimum.AAC.1